MGKHPQKRTQSIGGTDIGSRPIGRLYLRRLFINLFVIALLAVILVSVVLYFTIRHDVRIQAKTDSLTILRNKATIIESVHDTVSKLMRSIFDSSAVQSIVYASEPNVEQVFRSIIAVDSDVLDNYPYVRDFYILNGANRTLYSTRGTFDGIPPDLLPVLSRDAALRYLVPYTRTTVSDETIATYCIYDFIEDDGFPRGAVLTDLSLNWFEWAILSPVDPDLGISLLAGDDSVLFSNGFVVDIANAVADGRSAGALLQARSGLAPLSIDGTNYLVSAYPIPSLDWTMVSVQTARSSYQRLLDWLKQIIVANVVSVVLLLGIIFLRAKLMYEPIEMLISRTAGESDQRGIKDEFRFFQAVFQRAHDQREAMERLRRRQDEQKHWRSFFQDRTTPVEFPEDGLWYWATGSHYLFVLSFQSDEHSEFSWMRLEYEKRVQPVLEVIDRLFQSPTLYVPMHDNEIVLVCRPYSADDVARSLDEILDSVRTNIGIEMRIACSAPVDSPALLHDRFQETTIIARYHFVFQKGVLFLDDVSENERNRSHVVSESDVRKLRDGLFLGQVETVRASIGSLLSQLRTLAATDILAELMRLVALVRNSVEELNTSRPTPIAFQESDVVERIFGGSSLDEIIDCSVMPLSD